jgi:Beta-1,3-glucanase
LTFKLNPGPALVEPSVTNPSDPNINLNWGFMEFTYNSNEVFANISYVDFVSLPISLTLTTGSNATQHVSGIPTDGLDTVCARLQAQDNSDHAGWSRLIVKQPNTNGHLRALSPNTAIVTDNNLFRNYYQAYVDAVFSKYTTQTLSINTQTGQWGILTGQVRNNVLDVAGQLFTKPSAADIFSCSTGPFAEMGSQQRGAIIARLAAAFNRSTLLNDRDRTFPDTPPPYYAEPVTNHYSRIVHEVNLDRRGYAFPYDDVSATGGQDMSGAVHDGDPRLLTVAVGGANAHMAGAPALRSQL